MIKKISKTVWLLILSSLFLYNVSAQNPEHYSSKDSCSIYFKVGSALIDSTMFTNRQTLGALSSKLNELLGKEQVNVNIYPYASLEGSLARNQFLQGARGAAIRNFLETIHPSLKVNTYTLKDPYNWKVIIDYISKSNYPNKSKLLKVLEEAPAFKYDSSTKQYLSVRKDEFINQLTRKQWNDLNEICFPQMRKVDVLIDRMLPDTLVIEEVLEVPDTADVPEEVVKEVVKQDTAFVPVLSESSLAEEKPFYMAVKTNMLYDAALIPNIGVEFYLGRNWTIGGSWMYAWWKKNSRHLFWRTYGGELDVRKYFGSRASKKPLTGHHLGIYGQMLTYDFELGGTGYLGDKWSWGAGLEYGYSLPVARRLNIDFSIGIGYLGGEYKVYNPIDEHYVWKETRQRNWFGPTKAEISLVWLIGRGNYNEKGGKR